MILCGRSARHLYVANALCHAGEAVAIVQETGAEWRLGKTLRKMRPANLFRKGWRWLRDRRRYAGNPEAKYFFPEASPHLERPDLVRQVPHINHPEVVRLARELQPDLICVFGTSLIRGELLEQGRIGIINLHGGLSPEYRGADCTFWALYNGEPEKVGCTLHFIDAGIDTGRLIAHVCPEVGPGDSELVLFWRAVTESAPIYREAVVRLGKGQALGVQQPGRGRLYQVKDRQFRHERALARRLPDLLKETRLPVRIRWFGDVQAEADGQ
ncbi:MAG TPA: formyl transferase [Methylomirabilota bacterium]|nr:formyl transferase [Methylomirabilota bacterium]